MSQNMSYRISQAASRMIVLEWNGMKTMIYE